MSKKRKRKADIDIINDNDDIIDQLLSDMRHAAEVSVTKSGFCYRTFENTHFGSVNFFKSEIKIYLVKS
jgi:hypothetical protein